MKHEQHPRRVVQAARWCHEINRKWCELLGDHSQPSWEDAPDWQRKSAINWVEFHIANPDAGPAVSHNSWLAEKRADGWKYGPVKDPETKEHPCFVPYEELPAEQRAKDALFIRSDSRGRTVSALSRLLGVVAFAVEILRDIADDANEAADALDDAAAEVESERGGDGHSFVAVPCEDTETIAIVECGTSTARQWEALPEEEQAVAVEVFRMMVGRLHAGLTTYGALDLANDTRDFAREALEENVDGAQYLAMSKVRARMRH